MHMKYFQNRYWSITGLLGLLGIEWPIGFLNHPSVVQAVCLQQSWVDILFIFRSSSHADIFVDASTSGIDFGDSCPRDHHILAILGCQKLVV